MKVTIKELAKHLDLSIATVSRALDGFPDISDKTRARVLAAALEMGYAPDRAARQLRRGRTDTIGFILPTVAARLPQPFFNELIAGLADGASRRQLDLLISACADGEEAELQLYRSWVQGHRVDGLIVTRTHMVDRRVTFLLEQQFPCVCLEPPPGNPDAPGIRIPAREALTSLVRHVATRGFRRLAFLGGAMELTIQRSRLKAFSAAVHKVGLQTNPNWQVTSDMTSQGGYEITTRLLTSGDAPDCLVCVNDEVALGALHAAKDLGIPIGEQLAIVAFDGLTAAAYAAPQLTTIDQPVITLAHRLTELLHRQIQGESLQERQIALQPVIHLRESTGDAQREIAYPFVIDELTEVT